MRRRRLYALMAVLLALVVGCLPTKAYAYIGALTYESEPGHYLRGTYTYDGSTFAYIKNDYIYFDVCVAGKGITSEGVVCHTVPTATKPASNADLDKCGRQLLSLEVAANERVKQEGGNYYDNAPAALFAPLTINKITNQFDHVGAGTDESGNIVLTYDVGLSTFVIKSYITLCEFDEGDTTGSTLGKHVHAHDSAVTDNWGVRIVTEFDNKLVYDPDKMYDPNISEKEKEKAARNIFWCRAVMNYEDFPKTGHKDVDVKTPTVRAQVLGSGNQLTTAIINAGIGDSIENSVLEVYSDSYGFAAPFVAASDNYRYMLTGGVEGHGLYGYPPSVSYAGTVLTANGLCESSYTSKPDGSTVSAIATSTQLWGYRYLSTKEEVEEHSTPVDDVVVQSDAQYLGVYKKSNEGKCTVHPAANKNELTDLVKTYGTIVAQYRGKYVAMKDGSYEFLDGAVELSPSITASWDTVNGGYMRLEADGTLNFSPDVRLNAPTFKFYELKNTGGSSGGNAGSGGLTFAGYDVAGKCMKFNIDPKKNSTIVSISLPGNSVQIKQATIDTSGNLVFSGKLGMNLFLAKLEMQKLGYGYEGTTFKFNGVQAKGMLKVPKIDPSTGDEDGEEDAKPSILGFGGAQVTGDINTFKGEKEYYDFSFSMSVPNLFTTDARLKLVRLKSNGRLCPDVLKFFLDAKIPLDLTPATPVATVTGGGGGIEGLASTINGNYTAIPPVVLIMDASGQIMKVVDGRYTLKIGPSQLRFIGSNLAIKVAPGSGLKIVDKLEAGIYLNDKELDYIGVDKVKRTYRGVTFGGDFGIDVKIFNFKDGDTDPLAKTLKFFNNTITAKAALGINSTVAQDINATNESKWVYVYLGSYGSASCSLNVPAGVKIIGGKSLLGAGLSFSLGAETAFDAAQGGKSAAAFFKNAKIVGGVSATGNVGPLWGRVIYIIPKTVKLKSKIGFDEWEDVDWDTELHPSSVEAGEPVPQTVLLCEPEIVVNEDGEEALALVTANVIPVAIREVTDEAAVDEVTEPEAPTTEADALAAEDETEETPLATASVSEDAEGTAEQADDQSATDGEATDAEEAEVTEDAAEDVSNEATDDEATDDAEEPTLTAAAAEDESADEEEVLKAQDAGTISKTYAVDSSALPSDSVLFGIIPKQQSDLDALKSSLTVSGITLSWLPDQFDEGTHLTDNAWVGPTKSTTDADGNVTIDEQAVFVSMTTAELAAMSNHVTFAASVDFDVHGLATTPVTSLEANIAAGKLNATIQNPEGSTKYALYTYYGQKYIDENGKEQVSSDYLVDKREIEDPAAAQQIDLSTTGEIAPSGSYYVASLLVEKMEGIEVVDDNGVESTETAEIPVACFQSDTQITYTNTAVAAPTDVALVSSGNEVMKGTWKGVADADGYKVTIYQQDGSGNWVDTGRGYNYTTEDFESNTGLSYDSATNTYGIEMAPTVGGNGNASTESGDGVDISAEAAAEALPLSANTSYRIGVVAFKSATVNTGDGDPIEYTKNSAEVLSSDVFLPTYKPVTMSVALDRYSPWYRRYELQKDDQGIWNGIASENSWFLALTSIKSGDVDVWSDTTFTVTPTGMLDEDGNFIENPTALTPSADADEHTTRFELPDFDGTILLEVKASYTHDGVTDETLEYVSVSKDDIAPLITLDSEVFVAGKTGAYTLTGVAEPGAKIQVPKSETDYEDVATAGADGTFSIKGTLDIDDPTAQMTSFVSCRAVDDMDNPSELVTSAVAYVPAKVYTVTFNANGGSGKMNPLKVEEGKQITLPKCTFKAPAGKLFKSWNLGAPGKKVTIKADTVVKAQWKPAVVKGKTYKVAGQSYKVTKVAKAKVPGTVIFVKAKNAKNIVVPATVKLADKFTYKVTVVGAKAFTGKKVRNVTIGTNVTKLTAKAFNKSKATKIVLKTKKLKKTSVKKCLVGSKVTTVLVKVGTKKVNATFVTKYKKFFTKANVGVTVTVK